MLVRRIFLILFCLFSYSVNSNENLLTIQQQLERLQLQEGQRIQGVQLAEGRRVQTADAAGQAFMFNARERRESDKIDYVRGQKDMAKRRELGAAQAKSNAIANTWSAVGEIGQGLQDMGAQAAAAAAKGTVGSDRRLKKNIKLIGKSDNGLNIYSFRFKDEKYGK